MVMLVFGRTQLLDCLSEFVLADPHFRSCCILRSVPCEIRKENANSKRTRRKRGKKGGLRQRIKRRKFRVPLPTLLLGNVRSVKNKTDELAACALYIGAYRTSCALILTET